MIGKIMEGRNSMLFILVLLTFVVLLGSSSFHLATSNRLMERQSSEMMVNSLVATVVTSLPVARSGIESGLPDEDVISLLGQFGTSESNTDIFVPFITEEGRFRIIDGDNLLPVIAEKVEQCHLDGNVTTESIIASSTPASVCWVVHDGHIWIAATIEMLGTGRRFGMARDVTAVVASTRRIEKSLFGSLVFAYMVFLALMILILKVVTNPLRNLTKAAIEFARGNLQYRVEIPTSVAELGLLAKAFNDLGEELQHKHESLEANSDELEEANRVAGSAVKELSRRHNEQKAMIETSLEANKLALPDEVIQLILHRLDTDLELDEIEFYEPNIDGEFELKHFPQLPVPDAGKVTQDVLDAIRRCYDSRELQHLSTDLKGRDVSSLPENSSPTALLRERLYIPVEKKLNEGGVFELIAKPGTIFDSDTIHFCRHFIAHMEVILRNKALYQETIRRSHELERINQVSRVISGELDMDPLLRDVVDHTQNTINAECALVGLLEGSRLQIRHITPGVAHVDKWVLEISNDDHVAELVKEGSPILVNNLEEDPRVTQGGFVECNNFKSFIGCPIVLKDEVLGVICGFSHCKNAYTSKDLYFLELLASQVAIALHNATLFEGILARDKRRDHQLLVAQKLQGDRIPKYYKQSIAAMTCRLQAADELAGDFYDVFSLGRNSVALVIGDVANKGIAASLMTFSLLSMFRNVAKTLKPPCEILESINRSLIAQIKEDAWFATSFYGRLNTKTGVLTYSSAGHEQPIWYHADSGKVEKLDAAGYPLGLFKSFPYETREVELKEGDRIVLYTDGVTDANNHEGERFSHKSLLDLVAHGGHLSSEQLTNKIIDSVEEFTCGRKQRDDIVVAVLELQADPWIHKTTTYQESPELITEILEQLADYDLAQQVVYSIRLAIDEALANAWRHGLNQQNDLPFDVSYNISDEGFRIRVKDPGPGFEHESLPDPTVEENLFKSHGRGVFLIRQVMDEVEYNDLGNELTVFCKFAPKDYKDAISYDNLLLAEKAALDSQQESLEKAKRAGEDSEKRDVEAPVQSDYE